MMAISYRQKSYCCWFVEFIHHFQKGPHLLKVSKFLDLLK